MTDATPGGRVMWFWGALAGVVVVALTWSASLLGEPDRRWITVSIVAVASLVGVALPTLRRLVPTPGVVLASFAAATAAMYLCVPETSDQMPIVGFGLAVLFAIERYDNKVLHIAFHGCSAAAVLFSGVYGATGRRSALIGALFAMWPVVIVPAVAVLVPRLRRTVQRARWLVLVVGASAAVVVARTGALRPTLQPALSSVAIAGGASLAAGIVIALVAPRGASGTLPE